MDDATKKAVISHAKADMAVESVKPAKFGQLVGGNQTIEGSFERIEPAVAPVQAAGHKIGEGHAMAMLRLGAHELTNALAAFPDSNIRPMEEPGVFGNPTQQIVTEEITGRGVDPVSDEFREAAQRGSDRGNDRSRSR